MARRLMAGHRSLEPAVVVRSHPGQCASSGPRASGPRARFPGPRSHPLVSLVGSLLLLVSPPVLGAWQTLPGGGAGDSLPPDSIALLKEARVAQAEFEVLHRSRLHRASDLWQGGCDERVGPICLRFDGIAGWKPAPEDSLVTRGRENLLHVLRRVGGEIPGDQWVMGQRVRYLVDLSQWPAALELARDCEGPPEWWCNGLQGYALHRSGQTLEAGEAFGRALDLMGPAQADRWTDPGVLLDYQGIQWLKNPGAFSTETAVGRFWTLADPLFLTPGNERLSEHLSRRFAATLFSDSEMTLGLSWGDHLESILVRYGFGVGWERTAPGMQESGRGAVVEHHHPESRGHLPPWEAVQDPSGLPAGLWVPQDRRPRSASAPVLAPLLVEGRAEAAVLRRDRDLLVVVSYEIPTDTLLGQRRGDPRGESGKERQRPFGEPILDGASRDTLAGHFLLADTGGWAPHSVLSSGGRGVLQLRAPTGRYLLSMELWNPAGRWGARVRQGVVAEEVPPDVPFLSDLLVLDAGGTIPGKLEEALPLMRGNHELKSGERLTVGWEVYGLGFQEVEMTFGLRLIREEESLVRRALKRIGLRRSEPVMTLSWTEEGPEGMGPFFRAVDLELPDLDSGNYVLQLALDMPGRSQVPSQRRVRVR